MGGRGASSGYSINKKGQKGKKYGTEYRTILSVGNVKYIKQNGTEATKTPMETMSKNRVYVTIKKDNRIKAVTFYDENNKRYKTIDVTGKPHKINGKAVIPHTHHGYFHDENGTTVLTARESRRIDRLIKYWYNHKNKE